MMLWAKVCDRSGVRAAASMRSSGTRYLSSWAACSETSTATVSPPWSRTLQLPHDQRAPGIARVTLRAVPAAHQLSELTPTAELSASGLLTSAHLHAPGPCALRVLPAEPGRLRVAV
ncbi:hypothetical protein OHB54_25070 [Streptomyces sp. NBC_01007]|nr:hypothetical protein OHB54_25070 [Streptomyces sp. NBC_01007]